ncbi:MAG TPA: LPS export ABC transporter periplasmic protein LptC [Steroidobacteraceae bacterium]|nr:LPS export ABC transporter periplasmic protein LptC [Steroidobacteraceae bacterium]
MIYRLLPVLALALIAVAAWLTLQRVPGGGAPPGHIAPPEPGYTATDAHLVETGADGRPLYSLQARTIRQQPQSRDIVLDEVHMDFKDQEGGSWSARADYGLVQPESSQVQLSGRVDVTGVFPGNDQPAHIMTDTLSMDTRTEIIRTPAPVELDWAGTIVQARGLYASLKNHLITLEADVRGHSEP